MEDVAYRNPTLLSGEEYTRWYGTYMSARDAMWKQRPLTWKAMRAVPDDMSAAKKEDLVKMYEAKAASAECEAVVAQLLGDYHEMVAERHLLEAERPRREADWRRREAEHQYAQARRFREICDENLCMAAREAGKPLSN